jgi:hypothetical protein
MHRGVSQQRVGACRSEPERVTYPEMVYFMGLKLEVKTRTSFSHFSTASSSDRPTTDKGGWLHER